MSFVHRTFCLPLAEGADPAVLLRAFAGSETEEILHHDWTPHGTTVVHVRGTATFILHTWPERCLYTVDVIRLKNEQPSIENGPAGRGER